MSISDLSLRSAISSLRSASHSIDANLEPSTIPEPTPIPDPIPDIHLPPIPCPATPALPEAKSVCPAVRFILLSDRNMTHDELDTLKAMGSVMDFTTEHPFSFNLWSQLEADYICVRLNAQTRQWAQLHNSDPTFKWVALTDDPKQAWTRELTFVSIRKQLPDHLGHRMFKAPFNELLQVNHLPLPQSFKLFNFFKHCMTFLEP